MIIYHRKNKRVQACTCYEKKPKNKKINRVSVVTRGYQQLPRVCESRRCALLELDYRLRDTFCPQIIKRAAQKNGCEILIFHFQYASRRMTRVAEPRLIIVFFWEIITWIWLWNVRLIVTVTATIATNRTTGSKTID